MAYGQNASSSDALNLFVSQIVHFLVYMYVPILIFTTLLVPTNCFDSHQSQYIKRTCIIMFMITIFMIFASSIIENSGMIVTDDTEVLFRNSQSQARHKRQGVTRVLVTGTNIDNPGVGDTVILHCRVDLVNQSNLLSVIYTHGDTILTYNETIAVPDALRHQTFGIVKTESQGSHINYTLTITNFLPSNDGEYRCVAVYDDYGTGVHNKQVWAKIKISVSSPTTTTITPYPKCSASGGVVDDNTWLEGQNVHLRCAVDIENPSLNLEWTPTSMPEYFRRLANLSAFVENGTTMVNVQFTANTVLHSNETFVCMLRDSRSFTGMKQICSVGPIRVINSIPVSTTERASSRSGTYIMYILK